jgi:hypothetical protein
VGPRWDSIGIRGMGVGLQWECDRTDEGMNWDCSRNGREYVGAVMGPWWDRTRNPLELGSWES